MFFGRVACGILVPQPGIEPTPSAVKVQSPNHWTAKEFPNLQYVNYTYNNSWERKRSKGEK